MGFADARRTHDAERLRAETAEAITGWAAEDVIGRRCCDSVLRTWRAS